MSINAKINIYLFKYSILYVSQFYTEKKRLVFCGTMVFCGTYTCMYVNRVDMIAILIYNLQIVGDKSVLDMTRYKTYQGRNQSVNCGKVCIFIYSCSALLISLKSAGCF